MHGTRQPRWCERYRKGVMDGRDITQQLAERAHDHEFLKWTPAKRIGGDEGGAELSEHTPHVIRRQPG